MPNLKPISVVRFDKLGPSGNIYFILANVQQALRKEKRILDWNECRDRVYNAKSYEEALKIISEYVILKEV